MDEIIETTAETIAETVTDTVAATTTAASEGLGNLMNSTLSFPERITLGLQVLLFGMAVVFAVLILIWAILTLFRVIFYDIPNKKAAGAKSETPAPEPKAVEPVAPVEEPVAAAEPVADDAEIAAAIAAAIAVVMDKPQTSFRVVSFRRTASK